MFYHVERMMFDYETVLTEVGAWDPASAANNYLCIKQNSLLHSMEVVGLNTCISFSLSFVLSPTMSFLLFLTPSFFLLFIISLLIPLNIYLSLHSFHVHFYLSYFFHAVLIPIPLSYVLCSFSLLSLSHLFFFTFFLCLFLLCSLLLLISLPFFFLWQQA